MNEMNGGILHSSPRPCTRPCNISHIVCQLFFAVNKAIIGGFLETDLECLEISDGKRQMGIEVS